MMGGNKMVSIITCTMRDHQMETVFSNYAKQNWLEKELIIILNNDSMDVRKWKKKSEEYKNVQVFQLPKERYLGECLNFGIEQATYPVVAKFDDDDYYAPDYIYEAMQALEKTGASIVGKTSIYMYFSALNLLAVYMPGNEHKFTHFERRLNSKLVMGGTLVFDKEINKKIKFPNKKVGTDSDFLLSCIDEGLEIYSTSRFNYTLIRQGEESLHTWKVRNERLLRFSERVVETDDFIPYV